MVGSGALFIALGLFLLLSWVMTEVPAFALIGLPIVLLGAGFVGWGVAALRRLPAGRVPAASVLRGHIRDDLRLLAVGVVIAGFGVILWSRPVTCDDREMHRGDACHVTSTVGSHSESYEDRLEGQQLMAGAITGVGTLLALGGGWGAATGELARRRQARGG